MGEESHKFRRRLHSGILCSQFSPVVSPSGEWAACEIPIILPSAENFTERSAYARNGKASPCRETALSPRADKQGHYPDLTALRILLKLKLFADDTSLFDTHN